MLERGPRLSTPTSPSRCTSSTCRRSTSSIQGQGAQFVTATGVGGGSNLYLAASLRAPTETFERRDRKPGDGPDRRMWPDALSSRAPSTPTTRASRPRCASPRPTWSQVSRSGGAVGRDAGRGRATPATACRWRSAPTAASTRSGATPAASTARRTPSSPTTWRARRRRASAVRPLRRVESVRQSSARPVPLHRHREPHGPGDEGRDGDGGDRVQGADPRHRRDERRPDPAALTQRPPGAERRRSASTSAATATTSRPSSTTRRRSATCSASRATARSTRASRSRR